MDPCTWAVLALEPLTSPRARLAWWRTEIVDLPQAKTSLDLWPASNPGHMRAHPRLENSAQTTSADPGPMNRCYHWIL